MTGRKRGSGIKVAITGRVRGGVTTPGHLVSLGWGHAFESRRVVVGGRTPALVIEVRVR